MLVGVPAVFTAGGETALRESKSMLGSVILCIAWLASAFLLAMYFFMKNLAFGPCD
jgi:hypothetical protein